MNEAKITIEMPAGIYFEMVEALEEAQSVYEGCRRGLYDSAATNEDLLDYFRKQKRTINEVLCYICYTGDR